MIKTTADDVRYRPLYSLAEVGRYARVKPGTVRTWTRSDVGGMLIPAAQKGIAPLSFINLVESHVLLALRRTHRVPMQQIRKAVDWLKKTCGTDHPLAECDLETDGYDVFVRIAGFPVAASQRGQGGIPEVLSRYLQRIDRDSKRIPLRFYPIPYEASPKTVVIDPTVVFGRPVIKGTRITTMMVYDRYTGGESLSEIATDYDLEVRAVEEALRCELEQRAS